MTRSSGLYGLFRLDGGPVDAGDAQALGWDAAQVAAGGVSGIARAWDAHMPEAMQSAEADGALTVLAGHIEEPDALAARLGVAGTLPPALLARVALHRFGGDLAAAMVGEWALLNWDKTARTLTLATSAARRDRLLFAIRGNRVAVAPDLFALARIGWIGRRLDEAGLMFALGREAVRTGMGERTMLVGVRQLEPATVLTVSAEGETRAQAVILTPQPRWTGSFDDAVAATEAMLRRIMAARIARTPVPAALLSGGLDSSTLAWAAAEERRAGQRLVLLTSVAPPGSGLADEAIHADAVAAALRLASEHVYPDFDCEIYRPSDAILTGASRPPMPVRHCLTDTFQARARALGATMLIDGTYGEMTVTGHFTLSTPVQRLRAALVRLRRGAPAPDTRGPFHVRFAPARLAALPEAVRACAHAPPSPSLASGRRPSDAWGYLPGIEKAMRHPNEFYPGALRMEFPYRDIRLLHLFAGFPAAFLFHGGLNRAPARHLLAGRLPDSVRLRRSGAPASPDHMARLRRQAPAARERIAAFRHAELDDWIDLDWLDAALARVGANGPRDFAESYEVQLTAITAEFLLWWRTRF